MKKSVLSLLLAISMLLGMCTTVPASEILFKDVLEDNIYKEYIYEMAEKGIIKGYSPECFGFDDNCTKAQFITFLYRASGMPDVVSESGFSDVSSDAYYADAVSWAKENNIAAGFEDGTFGVDLTVDRNHAVTFLYDWAKAMGRTPAPQKVYLSEFADAKYLEVYAYIAFAWAVDEGIVVPTEDKKIEPKKEVTRGWVASAIGKLMATHHHKWEKAEDNKDGTHTKFCKDSNHTVVEKHNFNDGELIKKVTEKEAGEIVYTCKDCLLTKSEIVPKGTKIVTRQDLEKAVLDTAWSYFAKGTKIQYDSTHITAVHGRLGGSQRISPRTAPEFATEDSTLFSVCSGFVDLAYYDALDIICMGEVNTLLGYITEYYFRNSENQYKIDDNDNKRAKSKYNDPVEDSDVDACLMRYINVDTYQKKYASRVADNVACGLYETGSLTDYTNGLFMKKDGYDGTLHHSYYDAEGNKLTYDEVWDNFVVPYYENYEENLRPGDVVTTLSHSLLYIGEGRFLDCNGGKINITTGVDSVEDPKTAITCDFTIQNLIKEHILGRHSLVHSRPLAYVLDEGFDNDPGNDVAKDFVIPEKTKTRQENPMMDIDRTVDITHYGTVTSGENLTYTVKIKNNSDSETYNNWYALVNEGKSGKSTYKNINVTETVPVDTEIIEDSVTAGGKYENGVITWNVKEIKPGEEVVLNYTVKVTAPVGEKIVNNGGMVGNIPSNTIINTVGAAKLTAEQKESLSKIGLKEAQALSSYGDDTDFAKNIYNDIGKALDIPSVAEIVTKLFPATSHIPGSSEPAGGIDAHNYTPINMFCKLDEVADENKSLKSMLIERYWGGRRFFVGEKEEWNIATNAIHDFRTEFLEVGDIIVYATAKDRGNQTMTNELSMVNVMVYDGKNLISSLKTEEGTKYEIFKGEEVEAQLLRAFTKEKDIFFALRPSQIK